MGGAAPRRSLLLVLVLALCANLAFIVPAVVADAAATTTPPSGLLATCSWVAGCAWLAGSALLVPLLLAPNLCSGSAAPLLFLLAHTALTAWVPVVTGVLLLHREPPSASMSRVLATGWPTLMAIGAAPVVLLPSLPLWSSALPTIVSALGLIGSCVAGAVADGSEADEIVRDLAPVTASLSIALVLLACRPRLDVRLDRIAILPDPPRRGSRIVRPAGTPDATGTVYAPAEAATTKQMRWAGGVDEATPTRSSERKSSMAGSEGRSSARRRSSAKLGALTLTARDACTSRLRKLSLSPGFRPGGGRFSRAGGGHADQRVDLRSNVDLARTRLQQLELSLATQQSAGVGTVLQTELSRAIDLLSNCREPTAAHFDWSGQLESAGMDAETASFLRNTLSADHQHQQFLGQIRKRSSVADPERSTDSDASTDGDTARLSAALSQAVVTHVDRKFGEAERAVAVEALHSWDADMIALHERTNGHALLLYGLEVFRHHDLISTCAIDEKTLVGFLTAMEEGYGTNPYHSSIHAADVLMSTHLFLTTFSFTERLSPTELCATLVAAIVHDFNHPGTSNAHEMKVLSERALTYSDRSPLESHHLASAFRVLSASGLNVLGGLGAEGFQAARRLIIELVLHTDLAKHFEFISGLQGLIATDRAAREAAKGTRGRIMGSSPQSSRGSRRGSSSMGTPLPPQAGGRPNLGRRSSSAATLQALHNRGGSQEEQRHSPVMSRTAGGGHQRLRSLDLSAVPEPHLPPSPSPVAAEPLSRTPPRTPPPSPPDADGAPQKADGARDSGRDHGAAGSSTTSGTGRRSSWTTNSLVRRSSLTSGDSARRTSLTSGDSARRTSLTSADSSGSARERRSSSSFLGGSHFGSRRDSLRASSEPWPSPLHDADTVSTETLLILAIKFADLGHCFKPWPLHQEWSERVTEEFWRLGDKEKRMGVPVGPLCDRTSDKNIAKSQGGFFQFICRPFYTAAAELIDHAVPPFFVRQLEANDAQWKQLLAQQEDEARSARQQQQQQRQDARPPLKPVTAPPGMRLSCSMSPEGSPLSPAPLTGSPQGGGKQAAHGVSSEEQDASSFASKSSYTRSSCRNSSCDTTNTELSSTTS